MGTPEIHYQPPSSRARRRSYRSCNNQRGKAYRKRMRVEPLEARILLAADLNALSDHALASDPAPAAVSWFESFDHVKRVPLESLAQVDPVHPAGFIGPREFAAGEWINAMIPQVPSPGNHEYYAIKMPDGRKKRMITPHWRAQFTLPENGPSGLKETAYYIDYQGARIISLNSNEQQDKQADWLNRILQDNPGTWTVDYAYA